MNRNFVFDTNVLISAFLSQNSKPFQAFKTVKNIGNIFISKSIFAEFKEVKYRSKFEKYLPNVIRNEILKILCNESIFIEPTETINDCRDPKDNKFLELAIACKANCIVTGDHDLLILHPFRNIPILNCADFIDQF
jgi:uncharacterized protein